MNYNNIMINNFNVNKLNNSSLVINTYYNQNIAYTIY